MTMHLPYSLKWKLLRRVGDGVTAARWMGVKVGAGCRIYSGEFSTEPWLVTIGDRVTISVHVQFLPHDGVGWLFGDERGRRYRYAPIVVGDDVFIGAGAIVMPGVTIGDRCVIGAGSVVTKSIPAGSVAYGNPATVRRSYEELGRDVLGGWSAAADMRGKGRRARIDSIVPAAPAAPERSPRPGAVGFMGVRVADLKRSELVEWLAAREDEPADRATIAFAIHIGGLLALGEDEAFASAMAAADVVYADGVSAQLLARVAGAERIERAVTTDVGWQLLAALAGRHGRAPRVALVGGPPGLAEAAMERMVEAGAAEAAFTAHGYQEDWATTLEGLRAARPEVVFVGLGAPREMVWVRENIDRLPPALTLTCGGWFGYIVGDEPRAPAAMRRLYLEWLYRVYLQPRRLGGRYLRGLRDYPGLLAKVANERVAGRTGRTPLAESPTRN
jgi:N-acetylglucosaminyldiphosphoundecaprenol N-acetyl-beta-D-mannosaminyltransferase